MCRQFQCNKWELFQKFDSAELSEHYVMHTKISPLPDPSREAGMLASLLANFRPHRSPESPIYWDADFMPVDKPPDEPAAKRDEQKPDEQIDTARLVHQALGG